MNMKDEELWRDFCNSINDLPASARLPRALSRDLKTKIGSLAAPRGKLSNIRLQLTFPAR